MHFMRYHCFLLSHFLLPDIQKDLEPGRPRVKLRGVVLVVPLASHVPFVHVPVVGKRQDPLFHGSELIGSGAQIRMHMAKVLMAKTRHLQGFFLAKYGPLRSIKGLRRVAPFGLTYLFRVLLREVGGCKEVCVVWWPGFIPAASLHASRASAPRWR